MQEKSKDLLTDRDHNPSEQQSLDEIVANFFKALEAAPVNIDKDDDKDDRDEAKEFPEFTPIRRELVELVRYWANLRLDDQYFFFLFPQSGSNWGVFASHRISRIAEVLGDEQVKKIVAEVWEKFG